MRKNISICAITLVIAGLLLASASGTIVHDEIDSTVHVTSLNMKPTIIETSASTDTTMYRIASPLTTRPVLEEVGDQIHPTVAMNGRNQMIGYRDEDTENIVYYYSTDEGDTLFGGVFFDVGGDYPRIDYWKDSVAFTGTFVTDYTDYNGGATYFFQIDDCADSESYGLSSWDWSGYGMYDMIDASIAAGNSLTPDWFMGIGSFIMSTTYDDGHINSPYIVYPTDGDGNGQLSVYWIDGVAHCDVALDAVTGYSHTIYDLYNETTDIWDLFYRVDNMVDPEDESDPVGAYVLQGADFQKPSIAAYDDNILIIAESEGDIVCHYSNDGPLESFSTVTISSGENPEIEHVGDSQYAIIFSSDNSLYKSITENAGASWSTPEKIADDIVNEYKSTCITDGASLAIYENDGADVDIYRTDLLHIPAAFIEITSVDGGFGKVNAVLTNTGDADANGADWTISVEGGLVFGNKDVEGSADLSIGADITISSGFLLGFGSMTAQISTPNDSESAQGTLILFFVNL